MQVKEGRVFVGRFASGEDLLDSLTAFCEKKDIRAGVFSVIGALKYVKFGYYKQSEKEYAEPFEHNGPLEIVSCTGNASIKDSKVFVHAHIIVADDKGMCHGGHLMSGSSVFAAEYHIKEFKEAELTRHPEPETGLSLWKEEI